MIEHSVKIYQDTRRLKKDGTYPIVIRVIIFGKTIDLNTSISIAPEYWTPNNPYIKKSFGARHRSLSKNLKTQLFNLETKLDHLLERKRIDSSFTHKEIKNLLLRKNSSSTFSYFENHIKFLKSNGKHGTARWYNTAYQSIKEFSKSKNKNPRDFSLDSITFAWLQKFESWYLKKNNKMQSLNGLSVNLRAIRALLNKAKNDGILDDSHSPFKKYKIKSKETKKRALTKAEFLAIANTECSTGWQKRAKNFFLGSYYLYGMSFKDMCHLKVDDIKSNGRIEYSRSKTDKQLSIKVNRPLMKILDTYLQNKEKDEYIFNVLKANQSPSQQYNSIKNAMKRCNTALRELAKLANIDEITTYTARHSFASHLLENKQPIEIISQMMGHKSIVTTQVYLKGFNTTVLDEAHNGLVAI